MKYVSNMDELFQLTERKYVKFLHLVSEGAVVHLALKEVDAKSLGNVFRVTDMSAVDARIELLNYRRSQ